MVFKLLDTAEKDNTSIFRQSSTSPAHLTRLSTKIVAAIQD